MTIASGTFEYFGSDGKDRNLSPSSYVHSLPPKLSCIADHPQRPHLLRRVGEQCNVIFRRRIAKAVFEILNLLLHHVYLLFKQALITPLLGHWL